MNKKALYESIMTNISKQVKNALNESYLSDLYNEINFNTFLKAARDNTNAGRVTYNDKEDDQYTNIYVGNTLYDKVDKSKYPVIETIYLDKGTVLYHGSKTGDLNIDYQIDNYIYFTDDENMADEYSRLKCGSYDWSLVNRSKRNSEKRKVIVVETAKELKIAKFNGGDPTKLGIGFRKLLYHRLQLEGYDGVCALENGYYGICAGPSIYIFDLHNIIKKPLNECLHENVLLGSGHNGLVTDNGDNTVTKTYFDGKVKATDLPFYQYCISHECEIFPKVYEIGEDYIVMEKVKCNTPKCNKWIEALDEDFHGQTVWEWACEGCTPRAMNKTPELRFMHDVLHWCLTLKKELENIDDPRISLRQCDLQEKNIGEREDGSIVIFGI